MISSTICTEKAKGNLKADNQDQSILSRQEGKDGLSPQRFLTEKQGESAAYLKLIIENIAYKYRAEKEQINVLGGIMLDVVCAKKIKGNFKKGKIRFGFDGNFRASEMLRFGA